jgi:uncharacterized protein (TIGR02246 family)
VEEEAVIAAQWTAAYGQAWRERDPEAAAGLFTEDAVYRSHPLREPHIGTDAIREYWRRATTTQEELDCAELREAWHLEHGRHPAPEGWGR